MNKEKYNQIIDETYGKFITEATSIKEGYENGDLLGSQPHIDIMFSNPDELIILTKKEFTEKCKTDKEFSEYWGLKIEEQELSHDERIILMDKKLGVTDTLPQYYNTDDEMDKNNVPTKLITVTYNNETIEVYE
jgi:hypothetical protein